MSKRLILFLAMAMVLGLAFTAYAEVQNVKVSGDITMIGANRNLTLQGPKGGAATLYDAVPSDNNDKSFLASIVRVKIDADLTDQVMTTIRLLNERYWGNETEMVGVNSSSTNNDNNTDIVLDLANVTLKEFLYSPLTLILGRQELHFGNDMIIGDPDTNNQVTSTSPFGGSTSVGRDADLTARKAFDAVRAILNYDPLIIDVVVAKITTNNSQLKANDDTMLYGLNAAYRVDQKTQTEAYWFEKREGSKLTSMKKADVVDTIGARVVSNLVDNLTAQLEVAYQFGTYIGTKVAHGSTPSGATDRNVDRKAWAMEAAVTQAFPEVKYTPVTTLLYAYFSGDHFDGAYNTGRGAYRGWDPMFENQKFGDIANALLDQTNVHVLGGMVTAKPAEDVILKGEYYAFWWAKPYVDNGTVSSTVTTRRGTTLTMTQRKFVGQEIDLSAIYNYTEDVQFCLLGAMLIPGPAIAKQTASGLVRTKVASEVIGSMKVSF